MSDLIYNEGALHELLVGPNGAVARDLALRAIRVESAAKQNASHPPPSVPGSGPAVRTGRLRSSISWRVEADGIGLYADVGSAVEYAGYVELGTDRMAPRPYLRPALIAARY
jgi:phage gpG-like protein